MPDRLDGLRVLVVDDDDDGRFLLTMVLKMAGASVVSVASGLQALAILEVEPFGAIVSDIKMPGIDRYELVRAVRARQFETAPRVLAVSVTGMSEGDERAQSREAGSDAHLQRPIDPVQLVETIRRLRLRHSSGELPLFPTSCTTE